MSSQADQERDYPSRELLLIDDDISETAATMQLARARNWLQESIEGYFEQPSLKTHNRLEVARMVSATAFLGLVYVTFNAKEPDASRAKKINETFVRENLLLVGFINGLTVEDLCEPACSEPIDIAPIACPGAQELTHDQWVIIGARVCALHANNLRHDLEDFREFTTGS